MTHRPRIIDPNGHEEKPARSAKAVECSLCHSIRLRNLPWLGPCRDQTETPVMGTSTKRLDGLYRELTKADEPTLPGLGYTRRSQNHAHR